MNQIAVQYQKTLQKLKHLNIDLPSLFIVKKTKKDSWEDVKGILPKKTNALKLQKKLRNEWI